MKVTKLVSLIVMGVLFAATSYGTIGDVWDLGAEQPWDINPDGPWSYRDIATQSLLTLAPSPWTGNPSWWEFVSPYGGVWIHPADGAFGTAMPEDDYVSGSGGALIRWVSPVAGLIDVDGSLWDIWGGDMTLDIQLNGVTIATVTETGAGRPERTYYNFDVPVVVGDVLDLRVLNSLGGHYVLTQIVPEPMTLGLLAVGALFIRKRRA